MKSYMFLLFILYVVSIFPKIVYTVLYIYLKQQSSKKKNNNL
jgi:hypothetical protein